MLIRFSTIGEKRQPDGSIENLDRAILADTSTIVVGSLLGTSSLTTYLENAIGIRKGGRTGLTAVADAALFLCCFFWNLYLLRFRPLLQRRHLFTWLQDFCRHFAI